jgi:ribosomal-protein-alanine N-acetyltransferase
MTSRIYIRFPTLADQHEFVAAVRSSQDVHKAWITAPCSSAQFRAYIKRMSHPDNASFLICRRDTDQIVGVIEVTNMILGAFCSAYLGYYVFLGHEKQGLMCEGLRNVVRYAFRSLKLHRLEANIQPDNVRSIGLVKACGFTKEGYSPRYLKIAGRWRDHERWAILAQ